MKIQSVKNLFSALVVAVMLSGCAITGSQNDTAQQSLRSQQSLQESKIETPTYKQTGLVLGSITLWPDGSERNTSIVGPYQNFWNFANNVIDKGPMALLAWLGFDYLKKDSSNDAATAQSRPPVVRPEVVEPTIIETPEPEIIEVPTPTTPVPSS